MTEIEYRHLIAREKRAANKYVDERLSDLCEDLGWDRRTWMVLRAGDQREALRKLLKTWTTTFDNFKKAFIGVTQDDFTKT